MEVSRDGPCDCSLARARVSSELKVEACLQYLRITSVLYKLHTQLHFFEEGLHIRHAYQSIHLCLHILLHLWVAHCWSFFDTKVGSSKDSGLLFDGIYVSVLASLS